MIVARNPGESHQEEAQAESRHAGSSLVTKAESLGKELTKLPASSLRRAQEVCLSSAWTSDLAAGLPASAALAGLAAGSEPCPQTPLHSSQSRPGGRATRIIQASSVNLPRLSVSKVGNLRQN